jgi:hypothetical protein
MNLGIGKARCLETFLQEFASRDTILGHKTTLAISISVEPFVRLRRQIQLWRDAGHGRGAMFYQFRKYV